MLVLLSASMLEVWSFLTFRLKGTTSDPNGTASTLLVSGPFRFTRNPLYLSLSANLVWIGMLLDSAWVLLMVPVLVLLLARQVIPKEEARLRAQFGEEYLIYMQRVRRWL